MTTKNYHQIRVEVPCGNSVLVFFSENAPCDGRGLGKAYDLTAEDPRLGAGFMRLPVGRIQGCCQVCVCACVAVLYNALRSTSGMSFFIPGLNRPVCPVKNTRIYHFHIFYHMMNKKPFGATEGLTEMVNTIDIGRHFHIQIV